MSRYFVLTLAVAAVAGLGGCYETSTPKQYEPGVYKGSKDPLEEKLASGDLRQQLNERFRTAARDR